MTDAMEHARQNLARASLDHCVKCTICETQCPVARVTPLFSGPKFVGPQAERFRHGESVDHSLDYCSGCGICTLVCPQGVKIAELNGYARAVMKEDGHMPLRDRLITQTTLMGAAMTPVAPVANGSDRPAPPPSRRGAGPFAGSRGRPHPPCRLRAADRSRRRAAVRRCGRSPAR